MFPQAGGQYAYLKGAYNKLIAFLYGWITFTVINASAIASLSIVFAKYFTVIVPVGEGIYIGNKLIPSVHIIAVTAIVLLSTINILKLKFSEMFANVFTGLKILGILIIIGIGIFLGTSDTQYTIYSVSIIDPSLSLISAFGLAFIGVWYSSGGWQHASYLAGEAKNPTKTVPRAMVMGTIIVGIVYFLINIAYMKLLPTDKIATSDIVASDAVSTVLPFGGFLIALIIAISTLGTVGICTFSAPRIFFAMAEDGSFFKSFAKIHPKFKTPINAIIFQSLWAIVLLLFWGTFVDIITYLVFADTVFIILVALSVITLRYRMKDTPRPYKTFGYPFTPIIFIAITAIFAINILIEKPVQSLAGVGFMLLGIPLFYIFQYMNRKSL